MDLKKARTNGEEGYFPGTGKGGHTNREVYDNREKRMSTNKKPGGASEQSKKGGGKKTTIPGTSPSRSFMLVGREWEGVTL